MFNVFSQRINSLPVTTMNSDHNMQASFGVVEPAMMTPRQWEKSRAVDADAMEPIEPTCDCTFENANIMPIDAEEQHWTNAATVPFCQRPRKTRDEFVAQFVDMENSDQFKDRVWNDLICLQSKLEILRGVVLHGIRNFRPLDRVRIWPFVVHQRSTLHMAMSRRTSFTMAMEYIDLMIICMISKRMKWYEMVLNARMLEINQTAAVTQYVLLPLDKLEE
ncbi:hypothetical protein CVT24_009212 [Panaeolus cyanescens]|uniref:Uncharacterized protein n=1 Tax=Panaeolus cyanescens TaxID=181874 RepID=A0A409Y8X9_9AGAR|nr:hypothetical protein CVT24_009212 [Panaeolus cyanescens]